jgi:hypothetical protein
LTSSHRKPKDGVESHSVEARPGPKEGEGEARICTEVKVHQQIGRLISSFSS